MSDLKLTQADLNESLRGLTDVDLMMFLPDKNIIFPSKAVTLNQQSLKYTTNIQSLLEFTNLPQANLATFENNSWILDGSFISPSEAYGGGGNSYTGYISNEMTDDNGDYTTNPIIRVKLAVTATVNYLSIKFAGGIDTSYPKIFKIRTYTESNSQISEHSIDMTTQTGLPLLVVEIGDSNVRELEFEFVGTVCPHRRSRLNKIMFGKVEQVQTDYLQSWKIDDKASLVADSIPTKTLTYNVINYEGDYDIDNPEKKFPENFNDVLVLFTFSMEKDGLWKYAPTKTFNLTDISTTPEGVATFSCGSILDILTETYDHDIYNGERTIQDIMSDLLSFSNIGTDQCILNEFGSKTINVPLPESPVREIIQRLAFSCGATLTVDDNNKIVFSKKNIDINNMPDIQKNAIPKFMFHRPEPFNSAGVFLEEPNAEALQNTRNIAMYTYDTKIEDTPSDLGTSNISVSTPTRVSFSAAKGVVQCNNEKLDEQHAKAVIIEAFSQHAIIQVTWTNEATLPIEVTIRGQKVETTQTMPSNVILNISPDINTLMLDSGLAKEVPKNLKIEEDGIRDPSTFYYTDWYAAKFKYKCKTRNEYLVKAGDIIYFETPFSNNKPIRIGYVLRNSYSDNEDSGEMEVIKLDL